MHNEVHEYISATELVRNFAYVVDNVRMSGRSIYITKGTQTVAELSPPPKSGFPVSKLADFFKSLPKLGDDAEKMTDDLKMIKHNTRLPDNSWEL